MERNIPEVVGGVGKFIASKWGYMAFENRKPLTKFAQTALIPEGRQAIGDLSQSIGKDIRYFYQDQPSLTKGFVQTGEIKLQKYLQDIIIPYLTVAMKSPLDMKSLLLKILADKKVLQYLKNASLEQVKKIFKTLKTQFPEVADTLSEQDFMKLIQNIKSST